MIKQQPTVSVLMTAFNREQYIAAAIESVLASTFSDFELIVVDDCSTDRTVEIARSFEAKDQRVKVYVNEQNLGDYPNRNKAAFYASGKYLKYLDSDDIMYAHCLQVMVAAMDMFPDAGFGLSSNSEMERPFPICISPREAYLEHFGTYGHFGRAPGSSIIKREVFESVGGFSGKKYIGDTQLWFKLAQKYSLVKFNKDLVWDRIHLNAERVYEKKDRTIIKVRRDIVNDFLFDKNCPLNSDEIKSILLTIKRQNIKNQITKWL